MAASEKKSLGKTKAVKKINLEKCLNQAHERLERVKRFQKEMDDQLRITKDLLATEISL